MRRNSVLLALLLSLSNLCFAQGDSSIQLVKEVPVKYLKEVDKKIDKYSKRITNKTEKTLAKLSSWESKVKRILLKTSPATAAKLFAPGTPTFSSTLEKYKQGLSIAENYKGKYDDYRDKLNTGLNFLKEHKQDLDSNFLSKVAATSVKATQLNLDVAETEALEKFIKERKKLISDESLKYLGKCKYLQKINKESFYYVETLKNYKEIFSDKKKAEQTVLNILSKIPAFEKFMKNNSMFSSLSLLSFTINGRQS